MLRMLIVGMLLILSATIITVVTETSTSCAPSRPFVCVNLFKAPPKLLLTDGEIEFTRLGSSSLASVRVSPAQAIAIAKAPYHGEGGLRIVYESLGAYIDKNQIIPDWVGTTSWVPKPIPTYIVRIRDGHVVTAEPSTNHYWNVIVNAASGKIIASFTYD